MIRKVYFSDRSYETLGIRERKETKINKQINLIGWMVIPQD